MKHLTFIQLLHNNLDKNNLNASSWEIRSLGAVESTNDQVNKLLEFYDRAVVLAQVQTKGRGRGDSVWYSPEGGLWLSVGTKETIEVKELSTPIVNSVHNVLSQYVDCEVKEPNDILINGKKVCGVLVEGTVKGSNLERAIVGIGINVTNELPDEIVEIATRLGDHIEPPEIHELAAEVGLEVIQTLKQYYQS